MCCLHKDTDKDSPHIQDADDRLFTGSNTEVAAPITHVKRNVGYLDEMSDSEGSRKALKRLRLDESEKLAMTVDDE